MARRGSTIVPDPAGQVKRFLELLWPDGVPEKSRLCLTALSGGKPGGVLFAPSIDAAAAWAIARDGEGLDAYLQAGAIGSQRAGEISSGTGMKRGKSSDVTHVPGFYVDLDVGAGKFSSIKRAVEFASTKLPIPPTMLVGSGGGVHAWWLFVEPDELAGDKDTRRAEARLHGWSLVCRHEAGRNGDVRIDSVWDLARIGRIPGTSNRKLDKPRSVVLISDDGPRLQPSDLDPYAVEPTRATAGQQATIDKLGPIVVNPEADVPAGRFSALCENLPEFRRTWDHDRRDLRDQSNSGYDQSLANVAAMAGWTPQEVADLIVSHRRRWQSASTSHKRDPLKTRNPGYYVSTIARAFEWAERERDKVRKDREDEIEAEELALAAREVPSTPPGRGGVDPQSGAGSGPEGQPGEPEPADGGDFAREVATRKVKDFVRKHLGLELLGVDRIGESQPTYVAHVLGQEYPARFASVAEFVSWRSWLHASIDAGVNADVKQPAGWVECVVAMSKTMVNRVGDSGPHAGLRDLLHQLWYKPLDMQQAGSDRTSTLKRRSASLAHYGWFKDYEHIWVHAANFLDHYADRSAIRALRDRKGLLEALRGIGAERVTLRIAASSVSCFRIPKPRAEILNTEDEVVDSLQHAERSGVDDEIE